MGASTTSVMFLPLVNSFTSSQGPPKSQRPESHYRNQVEVRLLGHGPSGIVL